MRRSVYPTVSRGNFCLPLIALLACLTSTLVARANDSSTDVRTPIEAKPLGALTKLVIQSGSSQVPTLVVRGSQSRHQLIVTGEFASGELRDRTRGVSYATEPEGIVDVDATGMLRPLSDGQTTLVVTSADGVQGTLPIVVEEFGYNPPINFPNQVVPAFTKLGCNGGGCHGKSGGQNGFRLSLLGFEPTEDYEYLLHEAFGRRLSLAAPEQSLLLLKGTGILPHGGGARIEVGDPVYQLLTRWIEEGAQYGDPNVAKVASIEVWPTARVMARHGGQQLVVFAHYTDGRVEDVTRTAKFEANVPDMAQVSETGYVSTSAQAGDVAVMVRYQSQVAVFRATVPLGAPVEQLPPTRNFIDELVYNKLRQLGMPPSSLCDDATFLRRVTIDIAGRLPTLDETNTFLAATEENKREQVVDKLLASQDYADYFANKWSAILRNKRENEDSKHGTFAFHDWIRTAIYDNMPYDEFVRSIVAATGETAENPPVVWYREVNEINEQVEDTAQLFLGLRIQCARCHHHPFEKWSRQDYFSFAAFFSRVGRKAGEQPGETRIVHNRGRAMAENPKDGKPVAPAGLGATPLDIAEHEDPRQMLVDWMTSPENRFFAPMLVNRYWKHFMGRGLVDPEDDMRETNPASNPELLDALAQHFIESGFDMKQLVRTICCSSVYQLSSEPNEHNVGDKQSYSRYYPKRLNAEVLLDSIDGLTNSATQFGNLPLGTRAVQLPDSGFDNYFLKVFGRPESASACECERATDANLAQSLHLINSADIQGKIAADAGCAAKLASDATREHAEKLTELYLRAFSRKPNDVEMASLLAYLDKKAAENNGNLKTAYEDIVWTILNTKEFLFNH